MAKAALPPVPSYRRKFYVSGHAVERLRERRMPADVLHRFDGDLGNLIDWAVSAQWQEAERLLDDGVEMWLVDVRDTLGDLFAVVKKNCDGNQNAWPYAVVTLLDAGQVAQSRARRWRSAGGSPPSHQGLATLRDKFRSHTLALAPAESTDTRPDAQENKRIVSWRESETLRFELCDAEAAKVRVGELTRQGAAEVGLWRPAKTRVTVVVEEENVSK